MFPKLLYEVFEARLLQLYDNLADAESRGQLSLSNYCCPFIPHVGRRYGDKWPKIMYVGRATDGWDIDYLVPPVNCLRDVVRQRLPLSVLCDKTEKYVEREVVTARQTFRPFWQMVHRLTPYVLELQRHNELGRRPPYVPERIEESTSSIVWTNLFKIGTVRGNPDARMEDLLLRGFNTLAEELRYLKPVIVLFATGAKYDDSLRRIFPGLRLGSISDLISPQEIARLEGVPSGVVALRIRHPQGWRNLEPVYEYLRRELLGKS